MCIRDRTYPAESCIHAYTDGSATRAESDGGAGVYIRSPEGLGHTTTAGISAWKHCSNCSTEVQALMQATAMVQDHQSDCTQVVFLKDALSVPEAFQEPETNFLVSWRNSRISWKEDEKSCNLYLPIVESQEMRHRTSSPKLEPEVNNLKTASALQKRKPL